jgi:hypothetical protein
VLRNVFIGILIKDKEQRLTFRVEISCFFLAVKLQYTTQNIIHDVIREAYTVGEHAGARVHASLSPAKPLWMMDVPFWLRAVACERVNDDLKRIFSETNLHIGCYFQTTDSLCKNAWQGI